MVAVQVLAHRGHRAAVAAALAAEFLVLPFHAPHVRRRPAEVRQHPVELRVLCNEVYLVEDRLLAARGYLLALMGADGAERAAAEAAAVCVHAPSYHLEGRYRPAFLVFGVRQPHVRQVEAGVDLLRRHRRLRRIHHHQAVAVPLHQRCTLNLVALPLNNLVVLRLCPLAPLALLKRVQLNGIAFHFPPSTIHFKRHLRQPVASLYPPHLVQHAGNLQCRPLPHPVEEQIRLRVDQYGGKQLVVPVVVMRQPTHGGLDARDDHRHLGVYLFQYASVDVGRSVGTEAELSARRVGVVMP